MIFSGCSIRCKLLLAFSLGFALLLGTASAQPYFALPGGATERDGAVTFHYGGERYSYEPGLGWLGLESGLAAPRFENGLLYLEPVVLRALGIDYPLLTGVRSSGGGTVRLVLDFDGLEVGSLEALRGGGQTTARPLDLQLPRVLLPQGLPQELEGLRLTTADSPAGTTLTVTGPAARYEIFPLGNPTRLVIDLTGLPTATAEPVTLPDEGEAATTEPTERARDAREAFLGRLSGAREGVRSLAQGVTLRAFKTRTLAGTSQVDLVEIAPGRGRFQVQGSSYDLRTPSELTGAALVGINASYFDPEGGRSIGLLKRRGVLESLPSRNRAAIGFGFGEPLIDRLQGALELTVNGRKLQLNLQGERVTLHRQSGTLVSSPRQGAIVVAANGRVLENKVGPRRVPAGGFVLSYLPDVRPLALVDAGDTLEYDLAPQPSLWKFVPEAVEAGPLLVTGGRSAYRPALEAFDTHDPESNINRRTTRAALGVRPDGTVLLLIASQMTTAELVPLFLELGAEEALQLDSGGSSTLVVAGEVVNRPTLLQRRVATVIAYTPNAP